MLNWIQRFKNLPSRDVPARRGLMVSALCLPFAARATGEQTQSGSLGNELPGIAKRVGEEVGSQLRGLTATDGASRIGFSRGEEGAVSLSVEKKLRSLPVAPEDFDTGIPDKAAPIQRSFNTIRSRLNIALSQSTMRYGSKVIELEPGIYDFGTTLEFDGDVKISAKGPKGSVILRYTGSEIAVVVNSKQMTLQGAPGNTRVFEWHNVALRGDRATEGIRIGANTNLSILFQGSEVSGIQGPPINCGVAVYFLALRNHTSRFNQAPIYVGEYCDMLTIDDRSLFSANSNGSLLLECPTALISNSDFELGSGLSDIEVRSRAAPISNARHINIFKNRFGPEVYSGRSPVQFDIAITEEPGLPAGNAIAGLQCWANDHFSGGRFAKKKAPILIAARTRRFDFRGEKYAPSSFELPYLIVPGKDDSVPTGTGAEFNSRTDDLSLVHPSLRGLFASEMTGQKRVRAVKACPAFTVVYAVGHSTGAGVLGGMLNVSALDPSASGTNYDKAIGVTSSHAPAAQPSWIAVDGAQITTSINGARGSFWQPVYLGASGQLTLSAPSEPRAVLRVGRLLTLVENAQVLIDIQRIG
ncbi:hypothetical protein [Variovorax boronicumulans]|uniref:hypothetical protein n=1 Tax=Variovorax boronicumulans TaxID=436515 RepID=UPI001112CFFA|nr:hypothetical protein [Variovorax boronicumulans]